MDPAWAAQQAQGGGDPAAALSLTIMLVGVAIVTLAALAEAVTGRPNLVTRLLDHWSR